MARGRHSFGTDIRRGFNARMLGQALKQPGMDTRYWCSEGTVGTTDPETGAFDPTNKLAIHNDSSGCYVDVLLQPLLIPCTCQYAGIQAGDVTIYAPIRPGNRVKVSLPDGDLTNPVIDYILNSRACRQPTENRKPIFDNNRLLIHAQSVPIDIRTAGGAKVSMLQDGTVELKNPKGQALVAADGTVRLKNDSTEMSVNPNGTVTLGKTALALDFLIKGTARTTVESTELKNLVDEFESLAATAALAGIPLDAGFRRVKAIFQAFLDALPATLSPVSKTQ